MNTAIATETATPTSSSYRFITLIIVVIVTGFNQGLLLPLLTVLLDKSGVSSGINGLNSAALYIGVFGSMFFVEKLLKRYGYRTMIMGGMMLVTVSTLMFPLWNQLLFWFVLRILVGIGDSALHYSTQLWIVAGSPANKRGRNISIYGMSYAIGFSIGPLGLNLLHYGTWVPFAAASVIFLIAFAMMQKLSNEFPDMETKTASTGNRYITAIRLAWFALIPSFLYGYMESSVNNNFPIYGLRMDLSEAWISIIMPAIGIGSLILQLPLGMLSDRIGRKPVLMAAGFTGSLAFIAVPLVGDHPLSLLILFAVAGGLVGSFFSLGLAYAADLLPKSILPTANVIGSIHFSIGSIVGPAFGGYGIEYISPGSMFYLLGSMFLFFSMLGFMFHKRESSIESV